MRRWLAVLIVLVTLCIVPTAFADTASEDTTLPLPYGYAFVTNWKAGVGVYDAPGGARVRTITTPDTWVSVHGQQGNWVQINKGQWVQRSDLWYAEPSYLRGYEYTGKESGGIGFVIDDPLNVRAAPGISANNPPVDHLLRYDTVHILEQVKYGNEVWYRIGDDRFVLSDFVRRIAPTKRPAGVGAGEKWIDVNLGQQTLVAYEGDRPVYATLTATGRDDHDTVRGLNRIWIKLQTSPMSGGNVNDPLEYYNLEDVPWTMYFYQGYGVHGAYWHDAFGAVRSHGCVNLSPIDSHWIFGWAGPNLGPTDKFVRSSASNPGTWVYTH